MVGASRKQVLCDHVLHILIAFLDHVPHFSLFLSNICIGPFSLSVLLTVAGSCVRDIRKQHAVSFLSVIVDFSVGPAHCHLLLIPHDAPLFVGPVGQCCNDEVAGVWEYSDYAMLDANRRT